MKNNAVTTKIVLDQRRSKKDGSYPVKLRVTFQRKQKYYATGFSFSESDFNKITGSRPRGDLKLMGLELAAFEKRALKVINTISPFTFQVFEKNFLSSKGDMNNVFDALQASIDQLNKEGRASTAFSNSNTLSSLQKFVTRKKLLFADITPDFLHAYEKWMLKQGRVLTTVGIYLRALRTVYNKAISEGVVSRDQYPFGKYKYQIPSGKNVKKAITLAEIEKILSYQPKKGSTEERSRDLWIFSYLCNGMNIKDISRLKYQNIDGQNLSFIRAKTQRSSRQNQKTINVSLHPIAIDIIERWGNKPATPDTYIFPILKKGITPQRELALVRQATKTINKYMGRIAESVGIEKKVTTYVARHSFSTVLKRSGASLPFISESLGHSDLKTTESYLGSFEDDMRKEFMRKLLPDIKKSGNNV